MAEESARRPYVSNGLNEEPVNNARMSFGDHLEELRSCLIRALVGIFLFAVFGLIFGKEILSILCHPLFRAQMASGLQPQAQVLAPTAAFAAYLKIGILSGMIVAGPWVIFQAWTFVATGLYSHERRFVRLLVPASVGLFVLGVVFLYFVVLPIVLHFFIRFNESFGVPAFKPAAVVAAEDPRAGDAPPGAPAVFPSFPVLAEDPMDAPPGDVWVNETTRRLMVQTTAGVLSIPLEKGALSPAMHSQFAIDYYVSFVLVLALAFGIAFETPIVVFFLAWTGIVPVDTMRGARRYVLLAVVIIGAMLTPPDLISQLLLAVPMYLLFEVGIVAARLVRRKTASSA